MKLQTYDWHKSKGAQFEDYFGIEIPSHYGNPEEEYWALRRSVGFRDVSYFGKIRMTGKDAKNFLHRMLTNDVNSLQPGKGIRAMFLNIKGHIQADMKIYEFADHLLVVLQHYVRDKIMAGLDRYIIGENLQMQDVSGNLVMFQFIGPAAQTFLQSKGLRELPQENLSFVNARIGAADCWVFRLGIGYALLAGSSEASTVLDVLDARPVGIRAFEIFRVEAGMPLMQRDIGENNFPQEARLDGALNFQKGCYLGQEVIARIDAQGHVNKFLTGLTSPTPLREGQSVFKNDREIGRVTSAVQSPLLNAPLAMAYIRREFAKEGESVEIGENRLPGTVKNLPVEVV